MADAAALDALPLDVLRRRLSVHRLQGNPLPSATDVVRSLTCVQSQEAAHAFFSLGLRSRATSYAAVQEEFDAGRFVRTHILRPTWHFVAAEDLAWIQRLTGPRVLQANAGTCRRQGLDQAALDRGASVIVDALAGSELTRTELAERLGDAGLPTKGIGLAYVIMNAELEALICSGAIRGAQQTYALVADRLPAETLPPADPTAELLRRFVAGHGPTSVRDFCRWSSLTLAQARAAAAAIRDELAVVTIGGEEQFFVDDGAPTPQRRALLLPLYDELTLSYPRLGFPTAAGHPHVSGEDTYIGAIVLAETNVGQWRRTVHGRRVEIELMVAPGLGRSERAEIEQAGYDLAAFLELEPTVVWVTPRP